MLKIDLKPRRIKHDRNYPSGQKENGSTPIDLSILTQFYPPDYAATGQFIEELAKNLRRLGMRIRLFTGQPGYAFKTAVAPAVEGYDLITVRRSRSSRIWPKRIRGRALNGLFFCLRSGLHLLKNRNRGDVLLVTTEPPYLPIVGLLANLLFGLPYVCLLYDLYPDVAVELNVISGNHWLARLWDTIDRFIWKRSRAIIVLSSTMKNRVRAKCPEIADKISVIHSWANPNWIVPIAKENNWFAREHDLVEKFTVLYSGNLGRCHDIDTIIAAAAQLEGEPIQFLFVGAGNKYDPSLKLVKRLGLSNCLFLPYQDKQVLPYSLTACDLSLVSISPGLEGTIAPSKLYGILAAARPVAAICEKHSYLRHLIVEAGCGFAVDNGDGSSLANWIRRLARNPELVRSLGLAGRDYLKSNFTPEIIAQQYARVLSPSKEPIELREIATAFTK